MEILFSELSSSYNEVCRTYGASNLEAQKVYKMVYPL